MEWVDSVECSGQVQEDQCHNIATVDSREKVGQYPQLQASSEFEVCSYRHSGNTDEIQKLKLSQGDLDYDSF